MPNLIITASSVSGDAVFIYLTLPSIRAKNLLPQTKRYINHVERLIKMTGIKDILKQFGLTVPEDKAKDFDKLFQENYKSVNEVSKIELARDNYKEQLQTAQNSLKEFEGVDVKELNGKITKLTGDMATLDKTYKEKIADMEFDYLLEGHIQSAKARNIKAVKAQLDIDALKASKNADADIKAAIEKVKAENDYLFDSDKPAPTISVPGSPAPQTSDAKAYMDSFYANNPFYKK